MRDRQVFLPISLARRVVATGVALVYGATNVVFCHAAEKNFWADRRTAAHKMGASGAAPLPTSTDALILAQLPGGARLDFRGPVESSVVPTVPPSEHLVGGKIPVFESDLPRWLADVIAPYGNMRDVFLSKRPGAPLVIQIQDLHDSTEAQRNIAGLVEALQDERGVSLVGLEGAQGAFATEAFRSFPDADITKAVAEHFMEEGYLGGPEFAGITAKRMPLLWGVEDMKAYDANVAAVKHAALNRPAMDSFLQEARRVMNDVKDRRLSVKLLEFDRHLTAYHLGKEALGVYVRYLLKSSPLSTAHVPNLILLRDALRWEDALDFKRIELERAKLLDRMVRGLSKENLDRLVARSASYRLGRVTYGDYYRFLRTLCTESGIDLDEYGQLSAYVRYVLLAERINRNDLLTELCTLERAVQDTLAVSSEEKRIVGAARDLALLERLVRHAYTPADWAYQATHSAEIRNVGATIVALAQQTGIPHTLSPPSTEILKPFEDFCLQALSRNGAMVQNLLDKMKTEKRATAVLVAGGFHTEGLTQLLRQKDISYAVVTPKVNGDLPDGHRSLDLLARDPAPLEKLFAGETVNIPVERMVATGNSGYPLVEKFVSLFAAISLSLALFSGSKSTEAMEQSLETLPVIEKISATPRDSNEFSIAINPERGNPYIFRSSGRSIPSFEPTYHVVIAGQPISLAPESQNKPWDPLLAFIGAVWAGGVGVIRRVGQGLTTIAVSPPQPVPASGDSTAGEQPRPTTILSEEGPLLLPLEELAKALPEGGLSRADLIGQISDKTRLASLSDSLRGRLIEKMSAYFKDDNTNITAQKIIQLIEKWRADASKQSFYDNTADLLQNARWVDRFRVGYPRLYFLFVGFWESGVFLYLALPQINSLLFTGVVLPPLLACVGTLALAIGIFWVLHPILRWAFGARPRSLATLSAEIRLEWNLAKTHFFISRLFGGMVFAFVFISTSLLPIPHSVEIALGVTSLLHSFWDLKMAGLRLGDPIDLQFIGRLRAWRAIMLGRADRLWLVRLDGDNISLKNMRFDPLTGVLPGERASSDLIFESDSLFLEFKEITRQFFIEEGAYVSRGEGGDEFEVILEGSRENVEKTLNRVRSKLSSYFFDGPGAPVFIEIPSGRDTKKLVQDLMNVGGLAGVATQGNKYLLRFKTQKEGNGIRSAQSILADVQKLEGLNQAAIIPYNSADVVGVGFFTISMGAVNAGEVFEALKNNQNQSSQKISRLQANRIVTWGFRWANAALKNAKDAGRNRVHLATPEEMQGFKNERKKGDTEPALAPGFFKWLWSSLTTPSKDDVVPGAMTMGQLRSRLKRNPWKHLTLVTVAGYLGAVAPRAFHSLQELEGMTHADGNGVIKKVFNTLEKELSSPGNKANLARKRPDSFFAITESESNLAGPLAAGLKGDKPIGSITLDPVVITFNLSSAVFDQIRELTLPPGSLRNAIQGNRPDIFLDKISGMIQKKLSLQQTETPNKKIGDLIGEMQLKDVIDITTKENAVEATVSQEKITFLARAYEAFLAAERENAGKELVGLSGQKHVGDEQDLGETIGNTLKDRIYGLLIAFLVVFFKVDNDKAKRIVSSKGFQSLAMPVIEFPFIPVLTIGLSLALSVLTGPWLAILISSGILAYWHGKPVSIRGPPADLPSNLQTWNQFLARFVFAAAINTFALFMGGFDLNQLFSPLSFNFISLDFWTTGGSAYLSHAVYNFVVPEQYRLSLVQNTNGRIRKVAYHRAQALKRNVQLVRDLSGEDYSLYRLLTAYSHHNDKVAKKELEDLARLYRTVGESGSPAMTSTARELALAVAEWGADRTTVLTALLGGLAVQQGLSALPTDYGARFGLKQEMMDETNQMFQRVGTAWRAPMSVQKLSVSQIRNQMGLILTGGMINGHKDDQVFLLFLMGKVIALKHTEDPNEKKKMAKELEFLYAPLAERFSQDALATEILDQAFLINSDELYANRQAEFFRATGKVHGAAQEALEDLRAHLEARLLDRLGSDFAGLKVLARVKGIASINEKTHRDNAEVGSFTDLFGITVIFPEGKNRDDAIVKDLLKEYGTADPKKTGDNEPLTKEYKFYRIVIRGNQTLSPDGKEQSIEVQVYDHRAWIQSKTGDAAHWLYNIQKRLDHQMAQVDEVRVSGDLAKDLFDFVRDVDQKKFIYVTVRTGENQFVPLRLPRAAIPADAAAHRRVGLLTRTYGGLGFLTFEEGPSTHWKFNPLNEEGPLQSGMILAPAPEQSERTTGIHLSMATAIVSKASRPRTVLMAEVASKAGSESRIIKSLASEGRNHVRSHLAKVGKGLEGLDELLNDPQEGKVFKMIRKIRKYFAHGKEVPMEIEQNLLTPLAQKWGLKGPEEIFAYVAVLNKEGETYQNAIDLIVSRLTDDHLNAQFIADVNGTASVVVSGKYDRPGLERTVSNILTKLGFHVAENAEVVEENSGFGVKLINNAGEITLEEKSKAMAALRKSQGASVTANFVTEQNGSVIVEVHGRFDRPTQEKRMIEWLTQMGFKVGQIVDLMGENAFRFILKLKDDPKEISFDRQTRAMAAIRQIPDIPQGERSVDLRVQIRGAIEVDLPFRVRDVIANAGISLKEFSSGESFVNMRVSVQEGAEDTVEDILQEKFPSNAVTVERINHPVGHNGSGQGSWFRSDFYAKRVAWWVETPVLLLALLYFQDPLTVLLGGIPGAVWMLYPLLFVAGHVFNLKALRGPAVWELAGGKSLVSLLALALDPSGISIVFLSIAVGALTIRHRYLNLGRSFSFGQWGPLLLFFAPAVAFAGWGSGVGTPGFEEGALASSVLFFLGTTLLELFDREVRLRGSGNGVSQIVDDGVVMRLELEEPGGDVYPVYSLRMKGESKKTVEDRVDHQQKRLEEAFAARQKTSRYGPEYELDSLLAGIRRRIAMPKNEINAQAAVAEVFDLAIAKAGSPVQEGLKGFKKGLIQWLGNSHSLTALYPEGTLLDNRVAEEIKALDKIKDEAWRMIAGGLPGWNGPKEAWHSDSLLKVKWDALENQIQDAKLRIHGAYDKKANKKLSAVGALALMHREAVESLEEIGEAEELAQVAQGLHDMLGNIVTLIALLSPQIALGNKELEKARFFAALKQLDSEGGYEAEREYIHHLRGRVPTMIELNRSAQSAVALVFEDALNDPDINNVRDLTDRLLELLESEELELEHELKGNKVVVISKRPLSPAEIGDLNRMGFDLAAIVTEGGSPAMHGPTVANSMGVPYLTGVGSTEEIKTKDRIVVNGKTGEVIGRPNSHTRSFFRERKEEREIRRALHKKSRGAAKKVEVLSSPDTVSGIAEALAQGAAAVGLFRTEWLYMDPTNSPLKADGKLSKDFEDRLVTALTTAARSVPGEFNVRVLDYEIGGNDKPLVALPKSTKSGAQYLLSDGLKFARQEVRAILRAYLKSPNIRLFFPMVSTLEEKEGLLRLVNEAKEGFSPQEQARLEGIPVGWMVETPAAVENIDELLKSDFVNIGTKDLTMGTFDIKDPNDQSLSVYLNTLQPNVLSSIRKVLMAAQIKRTADKPLPVTACGTLAAQDIFLPVACLFAEHFKMRLSVPASKVEEVNFNLLKIAEQTALLHELDELIKNGAPEKELTAKSQEILDAVDKAVKRSDEYQAEKKSRETLRRGILGMSAVEGVETKSLEESFRTLMGKINSTSNPADVYAAGRDYVVQSLKGRPPSEMAKFRDRLGTIDTQIQSGPADALKGKTRAITRVRVLMEACYVLASLSSQVTRAQSLRLPTRLSVSRTDLQKPFEEIDEMGRRLIKGMRGVEPDLAQQKVQALMGALMAFDLTHWDPRRLPENYKEKGMFSYLLDLEKAGTLAAIPVLPPTGRMAAFPNVLSGPRPISFFGLFPVEDLLRFLPGHPFTKWTLSLWDKIFAAANYSVLPKSPFDLTIRDAVSWINDPRLWSVNVHVLSGIVKEPIDGVSEDQFIVSILLEGKLYVKIHEGTLKKWAAIDRRGDKPGYLGNMLEAALRHELAEADGVSHDDLVDVGLTEAGVNALYRTDASLLQVAEVIRRRYALALASRLSVRTERGEPLVGLDRVAQATEVIGTAFPRFQPLSHRITLVGVLDQMGDAQRARELLNDYIDRLLVKTKMGTSKPSKSLARWNNVFGGGETAVVKYLENYTEGGPPVRKLQANLARDILRSMKEDLSRPAMAPEVARQHLSALYKQIGRLHSLGGSLSLGDDATTINRIDMGEKFQPEFEALDIRLLGEIGVSLLGRAELPGLATELDTAARAYDEARWQGVRFQNSNDAVAQALAHPGDILIHVTENMIAPGAELTSSERTQLDMIGRLNLLLSQQDGRPVHNITFLFDGTVEEGAGANQFLNALAAKLQMTVTGWGPLEVKSLQSYRREKEGVVQINGEQLLNDLAPASPTLFRVKQNNVEWHLGSWAEKLAADILAVMGRLVIDQSRRIEEEGRTNAERKRFLSYQA